MANGLTSKKTDPKAWLQELKTNRQTQGALLGFVAVLTWLLWPAPPKKSRSAASGSSPKGAQVLDALQRKNLEKLPDLAKLDQARQLPTEDKAQRDLFLFDGPPLPPDPPPPPPIKKPPTPEEIAAAERARLAAILQGEKDAEMARRPNTLRYLGFIESPSAGLIGGFLKGEVPEQHKPGAIVGKGWKLVALTDRKAEFQNLKFAELKFALEAKDSSGAPAAAAVSNEF